MLVAVGLGIANHIEPVLRPAFAVTRVGEQTIDRALVGIGAFVSDKGSHFLWRWWQSDQVERQPTKQRRPIGLRCQTKPGSFESRDHEGINGRAWIGGTRHPGYERSSRLAKGPV